MRTVVALTSILAAIALAPRPAEA